MEKILIDNIDMVNITELDIDGIKRNIGIAN